MRSPLDRRRLYATATAVVVAVLLFACGGPDGGDGSLIKSAAAEPRAGTTEETTPATSENPVEARAGTTAAPGVRKTQAPSWGNTGETAEERAETGTEISGDPEGEPDREPEQAAANPRESGPRVFTNKDLSRYSHLKAEFGLKDVPSERKMAPPVGSEPEEEASEEGASPLGREEWESEVEATQEEIARLEKDLENLKKRIPSLQNPLLPRATVQDSDKEAETGLDNAERLAYVKSRIATSQTELKAARARLAELQSNPPGEAADE